MIELFVAHFVELMIDRTVEQLRVPAVGDGLVRVVTPTMNPSIPTGVALMEKGGKVEVRK